MPRWRDGWRGEPPRLRYHHSIRRLIKYINLAIGLVVLAAAGTVYWFAWRPLPRTSGRVPAPVSAPTTISRDHLGVPHIRASSVEDALFAQGYALAQDRLWQMDGLRRLAGGDLAEVIGPSGLESDREARRLRLRRLAEAGYLSMSPADRAVLAAYARGVNAFIQTHLNRLPLEFTLLSYDPRPWSVVDTLLVGLHMYRTLTTDWRREVAKRGLQASGDRAKVEWLFPAEIGVEVHPGSNAWVLGGAWTASGKPLLSNDMHLEYSIPGIWHMVHLQAPGLDVAGVALPGMPGVIVGHNRRIAWGVTNLQFDVQDLYLEKFDERTGRYVYRNQAEQAHGERERIPVKGGQAADLLIWVTRHGPLFLAEGEDRMSLRWAASEPAPFAFPFLEINKARDWNDFRAALARYPGPAQNFVYADVEGNIGYQAAGRLPIRRAVFGDRPVDGASGEYEWEGFIPFEQLPSRFNPPEGLIVSANDNPFPANYPYRVHANFAPPYRGRQIAARLQARKGWRAGDMLQVQKDVYSSFSHFLARQLTGAYQRRRARNPRLEEAIALLRDWNGQMEKDLAAPLVVTLAYQHLRRLVAENAAPGKGALYQGRIAAPVLERLLRERPAGWFPDWDATLLEALSDGVEEGRRLQGRDPRRWSYGHYSAINLFHSVGHRLPWLSRYFDIGRTPMSGSPTTVKQVTGILGPSMRMTADLAAWDRSLLNIMTGQSGHVFSRNYKDQWRHYYAGESFPMTFVEVRPKAVLELVPGG